MKKLFISSNIITMTNDKCTGILVEDGKIIKLVNDLNCEYDELIDLKDNCILPGFIDSHSHIVSATKSLMMTDLSDNTSIQSIIDEFKERIVTEDYSDKKWLLGFGYDNYSFADKNHPTIHDLDQISTTVPVLMSHISGHCGILNSKALELLNITKDSEKNENIGYDASGNLNGYIAEDIFAYATKNIPHIKFQDIVNSYHLAEELYAKNGITTAQECFATQEEFDILKQLSDTNSLNIDVIGYLAYDKCQELFKLNQKYSNNYVNRFKINGYKIFMDGSPQLKTAYMKQAYPNTDDYHGTKLYEQQTINDVVKDCYTNNVQLVAHCNGDGAIDQYIEACKTYHDLNKDNRNVIIHAQFMNKQQLIQSKEVGLIPSFFNSHVYYFSQEHIDNFGYERASKISPLNSAVNANINFTIHTDCPVTQPDLIQSIYVACTRITKNGDVLDAKEVISAYDALKAVTINAAYQCFEETTKGSIEVGKLANFTIVNQNPTTIDPKDIKDIKIVHTYVEGNSIYNAK